MHGQVSPAFFQCDFQFLHKQALATDLAQGTVQNLITLRGHAQQFHLVPALLQQGLDVLCLPQGQAAFSCCYCQTAHRVWLKVITGWESWRNAGC